MDKIFYRVTLTEEERSSLLLLTKNGKHSSRKLIHALILLNCDRGEFSDAPRRTPGEIAEFFKVSAGMVERVRKRFVETGLDSALDDRPADREYIRKVDGDLEARIIALCCSEAPEGFGGWSLRMLADKVVELEYVDSISHETVRQVLKKRIKAVETKRMGYTSIAKR
jgi:transposase